MERQTSQNECVHICAHSTHNLVYYYEFSMAISNTCTHTHTSTVWNRMRVPFFLRCDTEHMNENSWLVVSKAETCFNTAWFCCMYFNLSFARLFVRSHQMLAIHTDTFARSNILLCGDIMATYVKYSHTKIALSTDTLTQLEIQKWFFRLPFFPTESKL